MPVRSNPSRWVPALLALGGAMAMPGAAMAVPVTADSLQITYRFVDDDGKVLQTQRLTQNDLSYYVNRARCQCGEQISARVFLQRSQAGPYDQFAIRTFVGTNCGKGQEGNSLQNLPCARVAEGLPPDYVDGGRELPFELVWLSSSAPNLQDQAIETAEPVNPCGPSQNGEAGIWICVEDGMQTDCQVQEFIITGSQNENGTSGGSTDPTQTGGSSGGIRFDYLAPQATVSGFRSSPGDGSVQIQWTGTESLDINGFRVLCADMDGNPPPGKGATEPTGSQRTQGELYFTAENLCPGEVVYPSTESEETPRPPTTDTGTATDTGDFTTGDFTTGDFTTDGTATGDFTTDGTATDGTGETGGTGGSVIDSPLASLDWRYVCSGHVTRSGSETRVTGLENGKQYQFLVVAYDRAGNPLIVSDVLTETPIETSDFWEQCEQQGDLCGDGGFCQCRSAHAPSGAAWLATGLLLLGLRRRRTPA